MTRLTVPNLLYCTLLIYSQCYGKLFIHFYSTSVLIQFRFHSLCLYHEEVYSLKHEAQFLSSGRQKLSRHFNNNEIYLIKMNSMLKLKGIGNQFEKETHTKKKVKSHVPKFDDGRFSFDKTTIREFQVSK